MFHVVLYEPEIPPNTGNIIRLCANTGCRLHLITPLGFTLDEKSLRRAGLDYREYVDVQTHDGLARFVEAVKPNRLLAFTTKAGSIYTSIRYQTGDALVFGPESRGLPAEFLNSLPEEQRLRLPMLAESRSLNLSNAVAIAVYEAWRQHDFSNGN